MHPQSCHLGRGLSEFGDRVPKPGFELPLRLPKAPAGLGEPKGSTLGDPGVDGHAGGACELAGLLRGMTQLSEQTRKLRIASVTLLAAPAFRAQAPEAPELDAAELAKLVQTLKLNELRPMSLFQSLTPGLRGVLDAQVFQTLAARIDDLEFEQALAVLQELSAILTDWRK